MIHRSTRFVVRVARARLLRDGRIERELVCHRLAELRDPLVVVDLLDRLDQQLVDQVLPLVLVPGRHVDRLFCVFVV